ncbi:MAG TPA: hypothetical protein VFO85_14295 [Vicinamibacteria bacterium]|nr:hypothetical protein [Vicinamibacteria bacterium]
MRNCEVGRWKCEKCGHEIVAVGPRAGSFRGHGSFIGQCPFSCGAWINRGFRLVRPGQVKVYRAEDWDAAAPRELVLR